MAQPQLQAQFFVGTDGTVTPKAEPLRRSFRFRYYQSSDKRCALCRSQVMFGGTTTSPFQPVKSGHIDHVFPRARGGQNNESNLRLLCLTCNCSKGAK
jgi:5-methylcytosine-specific restriction endonuclease McrA